MSIYKISGSTSITIFINYHHPNYNHSDNNYYNDLIIMIIITIVQLRDIGEYQCQVNTEPKISLSVFLVVSGENSNYAPDHHHHHNAHYHFVFIIIIIIIYVHHHFVKWTLTHCLAHALIVYFWRRFWYSQLQNFKN